MAVERLVLEVRVAEAALREAGDGGGEDRAGENTVNVLALWPRPGKADVLGTTGLVRLSDHATAGDPPDRPKTFAAPVLKDVVEGDVALLVHVTDRDRSGAVARFFRSLAAAALADGAAASGLPGGALRHAFTEAVERGSMAIVGGGEDERVDVVAVGDGPVLLPAALLEELAASGERRRMQVAMTAPFDLARPREKGRLAPGRPNGHLVLEVAVSRR